MPDMNAFVAATTKPDQPSSTLQALAILADEILELKQFTVMSCNEQLGTARRIFTDNSDAYPVGGEKPIVKNSWTETIFNQRKVFVGNTIEEIKVVFSDWELIQSLGLESCLNVPIIIEDKVVGTLNCLNVAGHFTAERTAAAEQLKLPGAIAFLLSAQQSGGQA